jgi:aryl-alcohol dehydrogenase-like predicted oxidoreductase
MINRKFGKTKLTNTPIGLGLAALGRPGYINLKHAEDLQQDYDPSAMERRAHRVLDAAWQAGIRYFDAARSYGMAEAFLGSWLTARQIRPEEVTVGSKWGYVYTAGWQVNAAVHEVKEHTLSNLRRQREESDRNLGRHLDLYQIHSATLESGVLENQAILSELARYRAEDGLVIGLTLSGSHQAETLYRAMEVYVDGQPLFESVQATWNLLETSAGKVLQAAHRAGMGVIIKEALANGRLTSKNEDPDFSSQLYILEETAAELHTSVDALSLAAVLAQPWVDIVLSGATTAEQLRSNISALEIKWSQELEQKLMHLSMAPEDYWASRSALGWN